MRCLILCLLACLAVAGEGFEPPPPAGWVLKGQGDLAVRWPKAWNRRQGPEDGLTPVIGAWMQEGDKRSPLLCTLQSMGCVGFLALAANGGASLKEMAPPDYRERGGWTAEDDPLARVPTAPRRELPPLKEVLARIPMDSQLVAVIDCDRTGACPDIAHVASAVGRMEMLLKILAVGGAPDGNQVASELMGLQVQEALPAGLALRYGDLRLRRVCFGATLAPGAAPAIHAVIEGDFTAAQLAHLLADCGVPVVGDEAKVEPCRISVADGVAVVSTLPADAKPAGLAEAACLDWFAAGGCAWFRVGVPAAMAGQLGPLGPLATKGLALGLRLADGTLVFEAKGAGFTEADLAPLRMDLPALADPKDLGPVEHADGSGHVRQASLLSLCRFGEAFAKAWPERRVMLKGGAVTFGLTFPFTTVGHALLAVGELREAWSKADDPLWKSLAELEVRAAGDL